LPLGNRRSCDTLRELARSRHVPLHALCLADIFVPRLLAMKITGTPVAAVAYRPRALSCKCLNCRCHARQHAFERLPRLAAPALIRHCRVKWHAIFARAIQRVLQRQSYWRVRIVCWFRGRLREAVSSGAFANPFLSLLLARTDQAHAQNAQPIATRHCNASCHNLRSSNGAGVHLSSQRPSESPDAICTDWAIQKWVSPEYTRRPTASTWANASVFQINCDVTVR